MSSRPGTARPSRRLTARAAIALAPVEVRHEDRTFGGESVNVSLGGMLIRCPEPVPYGAHVSLTFRIPALESDATVEAVVRWTMPGALGVQFVGLRAIEVWGLNQLLDGLAG